MSDIEINWLKLFIGDAEKWKTQAIIFDFDGIIGDTEGFQMEKWNILLKPYGVEISLEEYVKEYCGKSSATEIPVLLKKKYGEKIPYSVEELGKRAGIILEKLFKTREIKLMPGARDAILFFISFPEAVCSAKDPEELEMKLSGAGLSRQFPKKNRSTQFEAGGSAKPHPAMYRLAANRLGVNPQNCIVFEDTSAGVQSAAYAGCFVIAMPNIYSEGQDFSMADIVVRGGWPVLLEQFRNSSIKFQRKAIK